VKSSKLESLPYEGNNTYIESLSYDLNHLKIIVVADSDIKLEVAFHQPIGFRCLDEGDLLEFWKSDEITNNWLVQIHDAGWYSQEKSRDGFLSGSDNVKEFLVKGQNDCVSILDINEPQVRVV
jgi:hypothetical protein